jgi:predicted RNase H-like HicB family nuclease
LVSVHAKAPYLFATSDSKCYHSSMSLKTRPTRHEQINIRVSRDEKRRLEDRARLGGYRSAADLIRSSALSQSRRTHTYTVLIHPGDPDEGGYWAEVPALSGCNAQGETYEDTLADVRQAIEGYLCMLTKLGEPIPDEKQPKKRTITAAVRVTV